MKIKQVGRRLGSQMVPGMALMALVSLLLALPQISTPPEVRVPAGSAAVFPCMASGYPTPDITWSKVSAWQGTRRQGPGLHHLCGPMTWTRLGTQCSGLGVDLRWTWETGQGQGPKCGCVCSWMGICHLTAAWRTTCCCCPQSAPRTQAPMSALPLTVRARSKPLPICRCQVRQEPPPPQPQGWQRPGHCLASILSVFSADRAGGTLLHADPPLLPAAAHDQGCLQEVRDQDHLPARLS